MSKHSSSLGPPWSSPSALRSPSSKESPATRFQSDRTLRQLCFGVNSAARDALEISCRVPSPANFDLSELSPNLSTSSEARVFLTAEWRDLVMLNYEIDPRLLGKYVPAGTELDSYVGKTYISLVGFRFCCTRLFGSVAIPFHSDFYEVNLRFYVRRSVANEIRRGVVFIAEIVPKAVIAAAARLIYGENYVCLPMRHSSSITDSKKALGYGWQLENRWCQLNTQTEGISQLPSEGSLEQFITEHYWGYSEKKTSTLEYHVSHVPWRVWSSTSAHFEGDASSLYGAELSRILKHRPNSSFVADGSQVTVLKGCKLS
ncbi:MAG: DUF2071 domain-containing protein [Candidatus Acidiferrum sp.]